MHSDTTEKSGSPRKRMVSRAMSEEESLRHIIQEAEETPKRLSRRDSRYGSLRRGDTRGSQNEDEPAEDSAVEDYEACLAELQSVERHQGVLLFQLDCLRDALEGAEEALAETQRENHQISVELERERERRRKLEMMVASLMQEVERLKEEKNLVSAEQVTEEKIEADGVKDSSAETIVTSVDAASRPAVSQAAVGAPVLPAAGSSVGLPAMVAAGGFLALFFKNRRSDPHQSKPAEMKPQADSQGTSVDQEVRKDPAAQADPAVLEGGSGKAPDADDNDESSGYEDAPADFSGLATPDGPPYAGLPEDELRGSSEVGNNPEACVLS